MGEQMRRWKRQGQADVGNGSRSSRSLQEFVEMPVSTCSRRGGGNFMHGTTIKAAVMRTHDSPLACTVADPSCL